MSPQDPRIEAFVRRVFVNVDGRTLPFYQRGQQHVEASQSFFLVVVTSKGLVTPR